MARKYFPDNLTSELAREYPELSDAYSEGTGFEKDAGEFIAATRQLLDELAHEFGVTPDVPLPDPPPSPVPRPPKIISPPASPENRDISPGAPPTSSPDRLLRTALENVRQELLLSLLRRRLVDEVGGDYAEKVGYQASPWLENEFPIWLDDQLSEFKWEDLEGFTAPRLREMLLTHLPDHSSLAQSIGRWDHAEFMKHVRHLRPIEGPERAQLMRNLLASLNASERASLKTFPILPNGEFEEAFAQYLEGDLIDSMIDDLDEWLKHEVDDLTEQDEIRAFVAVRIVDALTWNGLRDWGLEKFQQRFRDGQTEMGPLTPEERLALQNELNSWWKEKLGDWASTVREKKQPIAPDTLSRVNQQVLGDIRCELLANFRNSNPDSTSGSGRLDSLESRFEMLSVNKAYASEAYLKGIGTGVLTFLESEFDEWAERRLHDFNPTISDSSLAYHKLEVFKRLPQGKITDEVKRQIRSSGFPELKKQLRGLPPPHNLTAFRRRILRFLMENERAKVRDPLGHLDSERIFKTGPRADLENQFIAFLQNDLAAFLENDLSQWLRKELSDFSGDEGVLNFIALKLIDGLRWDGLEKWAKNKLKARQAELKALPEEELHPLSSDEQAGLQQQLKQWRENKLKIWIREVQKERQKYKKPIARRKQLPARRLRRAPERRPARQDPQKPRRRSLVARLVNWPFQTSWRFKAPLAIAVSTVGCGSGLIKLGIEIGREEAENVRYEYPKQRDRIEVFVPDVDASGQPYRRSIRSIYGGEAGSTGSALSRDKSVPLEREDVEFDGDFYYGAIAMGLLEDDQWRPGWAGNIRFTNIPWPAFSDWFGLNSRMPITLLLGQGGGSSLADQACGSVRKELYTYGNTIPYQVKLDDMTCGMALATMTDGVDIDVLNGSYSYLANQAYGVNNFASIYWGFLDGIHDSRMTIGHQLVLSSMLRWTWPADDTLFECSTREVGSNQLTGRKLPINLPIPKADYWEPLGNDRFLHISSNTWVDAMSPDCYHYPDYRWGLIKSRAELALDRLIEEGVLPASQESAILEQIALARPKSEQQVYADAANDPFETPGYNLRYPRYYLPAVRQALRELKARIKADLIASGIDPNLPPSEMNAEIKKKMRDIDSLFLTVDPEVQRTVSRSGRKAAKNVGPNGFSTIVITNDRGQIIGLYYGTEEDGASYGNAPPSGLRSRHSIASLGKTLIAAGAANLPATTRNSWSSANYDRFLYDLRFSRLRFPQSASALGVGDGDVESLFTPCYDDQPINYGRGAVEALSSGNFVSRVEEWLPVMHHVYTGEPVFTPYVLQSYTLRNGTEIQLEPTYPDDAASCAQALYAGGRTRDMMTAPMTGTLTRLNQTYRGRRMATIGKTGTYGPTNQSGRNWRAVVHALTPFPATDSTYTVFVAVDADSDLSTLSSRISTGGVTAGPVAVSVLRTVHDRVRLGALQ